MRPNIPTEDVLSIGQREGLQADDLQIVTEMKSAMISMLTEVNQLEQQREEGGETEQSTANPAMHPQYREELAKMLTSLNNQYNDAMSQRKEMILDRLCP